MRCPSCGTDNAPDSRFCGGCGTRFGTSGPRVAPTQKISDDANFPQPIAPGGVAVPVTAPGIVGPRSMAPTPYTPQRPSSSPGSPGSQRGARGSSSARPATAGLAPRPLTSPPDGDAVPPPSARAKPQIVVVDDPSLSLPIAARRPWGLIAIVLLLDIGLAVTGVLLLREGLADRPARSAPARTASPSGST
jgi:zinc ribbon protein